MDKKNYKTTKISLPLQSSSANKAEDFVKEWGKKSDLKNKILFRLTFAVNEVVTSINHLAETINIKGNIDIEVEPYTRYITIHITFPKEVPLDPTFDHTDKILDQFPGLKISPDIFWHHVILKWVDKASWSKSSLNKITVSLSQFARSDESRTGELYFLSMKPKPAKGLKIEYIEEDIIIAKSNEQESAIKMNPKMAFVLNAIDGKTNVRDIYYSFIKKIGFIHPKVLGHFIEDLNERKLIVIGKERVDDKKDSTIKIIINRIFKFRYSIPNADAFTETINRQIGWLWSVRALYCYLLLILVSIIVFSFYLPYIKTLAVNYFQKRLLLNPEILIGFYLGMSITIIFHEFSHAIVCKRLGGRVQELGIMFYYASICFFADTTDAWMFKNKWHRIMVSLAGPLNTMILACICGWGWILCMHWNLLSLGHIFGALFLVSMIIIFVNLIPFVNFDGYYILMDILEIPNLRKKSFSYLYSLIGAFFKVKPKPKIQKREAIIYIIYSILSLATIIFLLTLLLDFIINLNIKHPGIFSWILGGILVVLFFERAIKSGLNWYKRTYLAPMDLKIDA
ncbi:MAG: M50 family metallopeptidase [Candidatus Cloacimonetes bacterium]|nr:M50 family metallopeptidase [Candidatus Cloacimonadota bacterium]